VHALKDLTHEPVPQAVLDAYGLDALSHGPDYIIPKPFDPRLRERVAPAVAEAAVKSGVAPPRPTN
jgi:malate dehydrogenase (oxaloacetate-decarboxylating)(NADP+)